MTSKTRRVNLKGVVPEGSFISNYLAYTADNETPLYYDFWCAIWCLSSSVGRSTVVARPRAPVFLNHYIVLIAESATTRKSTAVRLAEKLLSSVMDMQHLMTTTCTPRS